MHVENVGLELFLATNNRHACNVMPGVDNCDESVIHKKLKTLVATESRDRESVQNLKNSKIPHTHTHTAILRFCCRAW